MFKFRISPLLLFVLSMFLIGLSSKYNKATELIYTNLINKAIRENQSKFFGHVSIPVGDILAVIFTIIIIAVIINFFRRLIKGEKFGAYLYRLFWGIVNFFCIGFFIYVLLTGLNYHIPSFEETVKAKYNNKYSTNIKVNLDSEKESEVFKFLSKKALESKELAKINNLPEFKYSDFRELASTVNQSYNVLSDAFPTLSGKYQDAKISLLTPVFRQLGIDGKFYCLTNEASIDKDIPGVYLPFIISKYSAYQRGIVKSDEASVYGYLASVGSNDPRVRYSAYVSMMYSILESSKVADRVTYNRLFENINKDIYKDILKIEKYRSEYGDLTPLTEKVVNTFNRLNGDVRTDSVNTQIARNLELYYSLYPYS